MPPTRGRCVDVRNARPVNTLRRLLVGSPILELPDSTPPVQEIKLRFAKRSKSSLLVSNRDKSVLCSPTSQASQWSDGREFRCDAAAVSGLVGL